MNLSINKSKNKGVACEVTTIGITAIIPNSPIKKMFYLRKYIPFELIYHERRV